jgi:glycosyltransferase involved in cell wall biosynthesis
MKLLVVTQAYDTEDPVLGFFTKWVAALAERAHRVTVIALRVGRYEQHTNVRVSGLGLLRTVPGVRKVARTFVFLWRAWALRAEYDTVLVHMNQEYVLIAGWLWFLLGKRVYLWRNHYAGSGLTDLAASWCNKVFCTSQHSYTAQFSNTVLMPVGVDTQEFVRSRGVTRTPRSVLFLSRIAPSKRVDILIDALEKVQDSGVEFSATICGSPLHQDQAYLDLLKLRATSAGLGSVHFEPGVPHHQTAAMYQAHDIFVNCSPSGMFDKVLFEAAASGCIVVATSKDWNVLAGTDGFDTADELADRLRTVLQETPAEREVASLRLKSVAEVHALPVLADALVKEMSHV